MIKIKNWLTNNFFHFAGKKLLPGILIVSLTALTIGTSLMGIGRVVGSFSPGNLQRSGTLQGEVQGISTNSGQVGNIVNGSRTLNPNGSQNNGGTLQNNGLGLVAGLTSQSSPSSSGACIVTLFGKQYNITSLLTTHSGGNVFSCGTDVSAMYQSRHGTDVSRMQGYLITGSAGSIIASNGVSPSPTPASGQASSGSCIVTLFGKQYNIASLLTTHSGGNVFACGTDMSFAYQGRHGTDVTRMQPYLITNSGSGGSSGGGSTPTPTGNPIPTPTSPPSPTTPPSGACIVTLFGKQYNITSLLTTHTGGNVFACGTDMSTVYQNQHGTNMARMQPYLITSGGGSTPTPTGNSTPTPTPVPVPTNPPSSSCVITLFGKQYDVTNLRNTHSGPRGSFFVCGSDMSSVYQNQHGTNMTRMRPYLVTSGSGGTTPTPTSTPLPSGVPPTTPRPTPEEDDD